MRLTSKAFVFASDREIIRIGLWVGTHWLMLQRGTGDTVFYSRYHTLMTGNVH